MAAANEDELFLLTDRQCSSILDWAAEQPRNGGVLQAFLASLALAALQPKEALALRARDMELADNGSGVLLIGPQEQKHRREASGDAGTIRRVPACTELVAILKEEITRRDLRPHDAIFVLDDGRALTAPVYRKIWQQARAAVLEAYEIDSPLGRNISALRDTCIAAWLTNGDQTAAHILAVAECAGMSAPRLAERFAQCLRKPMPDEIPWDRMKAAFRIPGPPSEPALAARRP
ncbi:hypothetical protein ACH4FX_23020 [Streptomyces sp. NPDC018019]|uniref:hypothetical protein n=1 Tax=Streptomyces sp. NPDC018019 TaxID=3365030 RepID=UPI00378BE1D0